MYRHIAIGIWFSAAISLNACFAGSAGAAALDELQDQQKLLEAERKLVEARAALEEAKVKEEFAREKALKEIFGTAAGKEGTITIGEGKPFLRVQPAGADAVHGLAVRFCRSLKAGTANTAAYVVTEAQARLEIEASTYLETLERLETELKTWLKEAEPEPKIAAVAEALLLAPVAASAIVSVLKLFRSDLAVGVTDNPGFAILFADLVMTSKTCKDSFRFPDQKSLRDAAVKRAGSLQMRRAALLDLVAKADALLKPQEKSTDLKIVAARAATAALKDAANMLAPGAKESKLTDYAAALSLRDQMGDAIRLAYRLDTQQAQVLKTGFFTGTQFKRTASAQVFYRTLSKDGDVMGSGYVAYSTGLAGVSLVDEECYRLDQSGVAATSCL